MSGMDVLVIAAGIAAIAWVNWYFFVAGKRSGTPRPGGDRGGSTRYESGSWVSEREG